MRPLLLLSVFAGALILSCAHQPAATSRFAYTDLEQRKSVTPQPPDSVLRPEQIDKDLDLLLYGLERGYGGRAFVPEKAWAGLMTALAALRGQSKTVERFCDGIADALWLLPDAHLSAKRQSTADKTNVRCGAAVKAAKRNPSVGPNSLADDERLWGAESLSSGHATFGIIAIKRFASNGDPVWADFDMALKGLLQSDGIVIDLRGNGGGDDSRAYQLAQALIDGPVSSGAIRTHRRQTPETATLWLNKLDTIGRGEDGVLAPHLQQMYSDTERARTAALTAREEYEVFDEPPFVLKLGPGAFKGPIAILVDEGCASSCESGLEVLRLHPHAKVFGQRTAGYIHFGDVGTLGLPNSGIHVGIPTKYNEYPAGRFYDKVGFEPDVVVASGTNAFTPALAWEMSQVPD